MYRNPHPTPWSFCIGVRLKPVIRGNDLASKVVALGSTRRGQATTSRRSDRGECYPLAGVVTAAGRHLAKSRKEFRQEKPRDRNLNMKMKPFSSPAGKVTSSARILP
jgi:hypothetical protein